MQTFILTPDQLNEAIVEGARALGLINDDVSAGSLNIEFATNGAILRFVETATAAPAKKKRGPKAKVQTEQDTVITAGDELSEENVKAKLATVMESPPGVNSIRSWTSSQRLGAVEWVEAGGPMPRPEFIVPRKIRVVKAKDEPATEDSTQTTSDGSNGLHVEA